MSDFPGNPYFKAAFSLECAVEDWMTEEGITDATMLATVIDRQAEATLTLAYEQRTANLIAYQADVDVIRDDKRLDAAIRARLGMGGDES